MMLQELSGMCNFSWSPASKLIFLAQQLGIKDCMFDTVRPFCTLTEPPTGAIQKSIISSAGAATLIWSR